MNPKIKLILESLRKEVIKEDNYDSEEQKNLAEYYPNHLDEHFQEELRMLCKKYEVKGLTLWQMYSTLADMSVDVQQFYN